MTALWLTYLGLLHQLSPLTCAYSAGRLARTEGKTNA